MYCHIISHTGWTWDYIANNIDILQANALFKHWGTNPPLQRMVAAYLGIETSPQKSATVDDASEFIPAQRMSEVEFDDYLRNHTSLLIEEEIEHEQ